MIFRMLKASLLSIIALFLTTNLGSAQVGMVKSFQKISTTAGGFLGKLDPGDDWGSALTFIGDIDGDNVLDLAVGAPDDNDGGPGRGAVWVLFMESTGMVKFHQKISEETGHFTDTLDDFAWFGYSVAGAGDLNGDNIPDLAVGAPHMVDEGSVWVFHMNGSNP